MPTSVKQYYDSEDDDETLATAIDDLSSLILYPTHSNQDIESFQDQMLDPTNVRISQCQNTYFMDGGVRFISLPTLGTSNNKATTPISRIFEEWLANKLYNPPEDEMYDHRLPILEDNVELLSEDIVNKFKSRKRGLNGLSNILIKIRTGHVYSYHQLENGQPLITEDMEDFFQQFPLFVEILIYATQEENTDKDINFLLITENTSLNPGDPYKIMENIQL
ncbi:hypothetical protein HMPREF1544_00655 [Mucor circinelloides 1006PhL]|uniref:Uncharacterized protein n=1 Tax=Mucor circinelloides f. circinelloides (strain 1006PhL) TaxID=1220926 RepID=S2JVC3_MUCC1|nr:hypothetical protein HMPREF1544_00655 [Mucor circinelloides 1006PhL]